MPGDPFKRVLPGQKLEVPATAYNAFLDAAGAHKAKAADLNREAALEFRQSGVVKVRNDSGSDCGRFDVLGILGPIILPADNLPEFQNRVAFSGVTPAVGHAGKFVVLMEPLPAGAIGRAVAAGVTPVRLLLDPEEPAPAFVEIIPTSTAGLRADPDGSAQVLWMEDVSSESWAVVRLLGPPPANRIEIHVLVTGPVGPGGWYPCKVQVYDGTEWVDLDENAFCAAANDEPLVEDTRYIAHPGGEDEDGKLYITEARESLACGLEFDDDGRLRVKPDDFIDEEKGLEITEAASSIECDKIAVKAGCGFRFDAEGRLQLDLEGITYEAMRGVNDDGTGCSLSIAYDPCTLTLIPDVLEPGLEVLAVSLTSIAGDGLEVFDPSTLDPGDPEYDPDGCRQLRVTATGDGTYFALVTGEADGLGFYPCEIQKDSGVGFETIDPDESSFVYEPQERPLVVGTRYICQFQYEVDDEFVYVSQAREDLACGLEFDDDGRVQIDLEAVVEPEEGLEIIEGDSETCDKLAAKISDGLEFDENGAIVVVVGDGLEINAENQVMVNKGCGLEFDEGVLVVDVDPTDTSSNRLNGPGLTGELQDGCMRLAVDCGDGLEITDDQVAVKAGCGLGFDVGSLVVDVDPTDTSGSRINGPGLTGELQDGCMRLAVDCGDGLEISGDQTAVKAGCGLGFDTGSLVVDVDPTDTSGSRVNGPGLTGELQDGCMRLAVDCGSGLEISGDQVAVKAGCGLGFDADSLVVDVDPTETSGSRINGPGLTGELQDGCMRLAVCVDDDSIVIDGGCLRMGGDGSWQSQAVVTAVNVDEDGHVTSVETGVMTWWGGWNA